MLAAAIDAEQAGPHKPVHRERYVYYPDDDPTRPMHLMGDPRAAFMPAFAHQLYEKEGYKWILSGDDVRTRCI
jgi:hypothetical protein